jgi:hypothetical protein
MESWVLCTCVHMHVWHGIQMHPLQPTHHYGQHTRQLHFALSSCGATACWLCLGNDRPRPVLEEALLPDHTDDLQAEHLPVNAAGSITHWCTCDSAD